MTLGKNNRIIEYSEQSLFYTLALTYLTLWGEVVFETATVLLIRDLAKPSFGIGLVMVELCLLGIVNYGTTLFSSRNGQVLSSKTPMVHCDVQAPNIKLAPLAFTHAGP